MAARLLGDDGDGRGDHGRRGGGVTGGRGDDDDDGDGAPAR